MALFKALQMDGTVSLTFLPDREDIGLLGRRYRLMIARNWHKEVAWKQLYRQVKEE